MRGGTSAIHVLALSSASASHARLGVQDYNVTYYCAEAVNTLTNLIFIYLGAKGLRNVIKYGHSSVFILTFLGYMVIGVGSAAFHATLKCKCEA